MKVSGVFLALALSVTTVSEKYVRKHVNLTTRVVLTSVSIAPLVFLEQNSYISCIIKINCASSPDIAEDKMRSPAGNCNCIDPLSIQINNSIII